MVLWFGLYGSVLHTVAGSWFCMVSASRLVYSGSPPPPPARGKRRRKAIVRAAPRRAAPRGVVLLYLPPYLNSGNAGTVPP